MSSGPLTQSQWALVVRALLNEPTKERVHVHPVPQATNYALDMQVEDPLTSEDNKM